MIRRLAVVLVAIPLMVALSLSCGPEETPEQRLARLRDAHEIIPVGYTTITDPDGTPRMIVDLQVAQLRVTANDGQARVHVRGKLDLHDTVPANPPVDLIDRAVHEAGFNFNQKTVALLGLAVWLARKAKARRIRAATTRPTATS